MRQWRMFSSVVFYMYKFTHRLRKDSTKYNLTKLIYYEVFNDISYVITREKQIKVLEKRTFI